MVKGVFILLFYFLFLWLFLFWAGKEYSKGDSRYAGRDVGVVAVEGLTAVLEGPACLFAM